MVGIRSGHGAKFYVRSDEGILLRYSAKSKAFKVLNNRSECVKTTFMLYLMRKTLNNRKVVQVKIIKGLNSSQLKI